ncbi:hypothetical protein HNR25_003589 [Streptomonospora salina]|uniref:Uncharacterized protein n=1 Tax=Streptomonospora salina TaxID=104205 RepID=A0A841EG42_9ACTN|nr:hypothetical protein [Streptomonospora salina]
MHTVHPDELDAATRAIEAGEPVIVPTRPCLRSPG